MTKTLIFDIETDSLDATKVWCLCAMDADTREEFRYGPGRLQEALEDLLPQYQVLVGHKISTFDLEVLRNLYGYVHNGEVIDTLVLTKLMYPDIPKGNSLAAWGDRLFVPKLVFKDFSEYSEEMLEYCMNDVRVTYSIYNTIYNIYSKEYTNKECYYIEYMVDKIIDQQEKNGIYFDTDKAKEYITLLDTEIHACDIEISTYYTTSIIQGSTVDTPFTMKGTLKKPIADYLTKYNIPHDMVCGPFTKIDYEEFNANSYAQLKKLLLQNGWKPDEWTPAGMPAMSDASLLGCGELGSIIVRRGKLSHALSKLEGLLERTRMDHRIPAAANSCATNTGRMRHIAVANIPRVTFNKKEQRLVWYPEEQNSFFGTEFRSLFKAAPGRVLGGYDAKGLELRMLAHFINNKKYTEIVAYGDPHEFTQRETGLPSRDDAKTLIYALVYGARDTKIGSIVGGGAREGAAIRKRLFKAIPGFERLTQRVEAAAQKGYLIGLDGRKMHVREGKSPLNTLLQGNGAICMKKIMVSVNTKAQEMCFPGIKVLDMHDESQWEMDNKPIVEYQYIELVEGAFVECTDHFKLKCPLAADVKFGQTWAETH